MYLSHFGLKRQPFGIDSDPAFYWENPLVKEQLEGLKAAVRREAACLALTGDVGTGKSILARHLLEADSGLCFTLSLGGPEATADAFYDVLALELGMPADAALRGSFQDRLREFLPRSYDAGKKIWLMIEESQRVRPELLTEIAALADFQAGGRHGFGVVFLGTPELDELLDRPENAGLKRRIRARARLAPLPSAADTRAYVGHRLAQAGAERPLFAEAALDAVHELSRGYPRLINMICDHALLYGYGAHLELITEKLVHDCSQDLLVALERDVAPVIEYRPGMVEALEEPAAPAAAVHDLRRILLITGAVCLAGLVLFLLIR